MTFQFPQNIVAGIIAGIIGHCFWIALQEAISKLSQWNVSNGRVSSIRVFLQPTKCPGEDELKSGIFSEYEIICHVLDIECALLQALAVIDILGAFRYFILGIIF